MSLNIQLGIDAKALAWVNADVPVLGPTRIVVLPIGGTRSELTATAIAQELVAELDTIGPSTRDLPGLSIEPARTKVEKLILLVLVGDHEGWQKHSELVNRILTQLEVSNDESFRIMPVYHSDDGLGATFPKDGPSIHHINFESWTHEAAEIVPSIMAAAGVTPAQFRVFISYRRQDTQEMAGQLFQALTQEGFQVFVDRFAIPPAVNFQRYLMEQLDGMSMVVFLESQNFRSFWTWKEAAFAQRRRLGVCSLHIPGAPTIPVVPEDFRLRLDASDLEITPGFGNTRLAEGSVRTAVERIKREHNSAHLRRRRFLINTLEAALQNAGIAKAAFQVEGGLLHGSHAGKPFKIWINPRVPNLTDFHSTFFTGPKAVSAGILAPHRALANGPRDQLLWLGKLCQVSLWDPDHAVNLAKRVAKGSL